MTDVSRPVRIAFIGCGGVAELHRQAIMRCDEAQLTAVYDIDEVRGRSKAAEWKVAFRSLPEIVRASDIDAIYVLTPMEYHLDYARQALQNGKHVLIEKPVSVDLDGIRQLIELSNATGNVCMPGHSYLYLPEFRRMKRHLNAGTIGLPTAMFMSEIYLMPDEQVRRYQGPSIEVLCHQFYMMLALLGRPERVQAFAGSFRKELFPDGDEHVSVNAMFDDGKMAHLFVSWANHDETSDPWTFKLKVWGTKGGAHFSRRDLVNGSEEEMRDYPLYLEMFEQETAYFVNNCIHKGEPPLSTMTDALHTMMIVKAVRRSFKNRTVEILQY